MPQAYSNDLRRKFLQAYDEGEGTLEELVSRAIPGEFGLGEKDLRPSFPHRRSGSPGVAARTGKPGYPGSAGVDPKANPRSAGYDATGIARATGRGEAGAFEYGADVVGAAAAGAAT